MSDRRSPLTVAGAAPELSLSGSHRVPVSPRVQRGTNVGGTLEPAFGRGQLPIGGGGADLGRPWQSRHSWMGGPGKLSVAACSYEMPRHGPKALLAQLLGLLAAAAAEAAEPPRRIVSSTNAPTSSSWRWSRAERIASVSPIGSDELSFSAEGLRGLPSNSGRGESVLLTECGSGARPARSNRMAGATCCAARASRSWWSGCGRGSPRAGSRSALCPTARRRGEGRGADRRDRRGARPRPRRCAGTAHRAGAPAPRLYPWRDKHPGRASAPYRARAGTRRLGLAQGGTVSLERLVADPPDYLLMAESDRGAIDQGSALLWHPALRGTFRQSGGSICRTGSPSAAGPQPRRRSTHSQRKCGRRSDDAAMMGNPTMMREKADDDEATARR